MKNQSRPNFQNQQSTQVSLHLLIDQLMYSLVPEATRKRSFLLNAVDRGVTVNTNEDMFTYILSNMITGAVNCTDNGCIRIEALLDNGQTRICVKNNSHYFYSTVSQLLGPVHSLAQQLGGSISIDNKSNSGTTVSLTIFQ